MCRRIMSSLRSRRPPLDRRFASPASAGAIAGAVAAAGPALAAPPEAPAQAVERSGPPSFAAIVQSVKPAVISGRAKVSETNSEEMGSQDNGHEQRRPPVFGRPPCDRLLRVHGI